MHAYRSHTCGALRASDAGASVRLSGWVHRKRDHGGLMFIDLRDNYGLLTVAAGDNVVRVLPPLVIEESHISEFIEKLSEGARIYVPASDE